MHEQRAVAAGATPVQQRHDEAGTASKSRLKQSLREAGSYDAQVQMLSPSGDDGGAGGVEAERTSAPSGAGGGKERDFDAGRLAASAPKIIGAVQKLRAAKAKLDAQSGDSDDALKNGEQILAIAQSLNNIAKEISGVSDRWKQANAMFAKTGDLLDAADKLIQVAELVSNGIDCQRALDNFQQDGSYDNAKAWALKVGGVFDSATVLLEAVPPGVPGFMKDYWKGLLGAPKAYIGAFITMLEARYGKIDKDANLDDRKQRTSDGSWKGPLTMMYYNAFGLIGLQGFMSSHRKSEGVDLWSTSVRVGGHLLMAALAAEGQPTAWIDYVRKYVDAVPLTGSYKTSTGSLQLWESNGNVSGVYGGAAGSGTVWGRRQGDEVKGTWGSSDKRWTGAFSWAFGIDLSTFEGSWSSNDGGGGDWSGRRT